MAKRAILTQTEQQIRERAYAIYLARQDREGNEVSDWLAAEREVKGKTRAAARLALNVGLLM
jgi:DUF2934 family protein